jgi:hypothetical protein
MIVKVRKRGNNWGSWGLYKSQKRTGKTQVSPGDVIQEGRA